MKEIEIGGITFALDLRPGSERDISTTDRFVMVKTEKMLSFYEGLKSDNPKNILEIGTFEGGSLVFFDKIYSPDVLVGIDSRKEPIDPLEDYRKSRPYIKMYYGRYQEQQGTKSAAQENFPNGIDLVVDDASHLYSQTKRTFQLLFPLVRAGGVYIIEDWGWSHGKAYQGSGAVWENQSALTNFVFELILLTSKSSAIENVTVNNNLISIRKGKGVLPEDAFCFESILRGRTLSKI